MESADEPTAKWSVPLSDGTHVIIFEHGTATGRRVVKVDDKELIHRDWMFHLVGDEVFTFNDNKFVIRVDPIPGQLARRTHKICMQIKQVSQHVKFMQV